METLIVVLLLLVLGGETAIMAMQAVARRNDKAWEANQMAELKKISILHRQVIGDDAGSQSEHGQ